MKEISQILVNLTIKVIAILSKPRYIGL